MNNVDRIHAIYAAFARGDIAAILESIREDADWGHDGECGGVLGWLQVGRGRDVAKRYFEGVGATMDFHGFAPRVVAGQDDHVVAMVDVEFTARPTGRRVAHTQGMWFTFDDRGRITRYRVLLDRPFFQAFEA